MKLPSTRTNTIKGSNPITFAFVDQAIRPRDFPQKIGSCGICFDGRENHGSGQGKLRHKGAYSPLTARLAFGAERIQTLCSTAPHGLARFKQSFDAHKRLSKQIPEEPKNYLCWLLIQVVRAAMCSNDQNFIKAVLSY